ncbi:MAG: DegT/DnrJ/EryC1/StrS aminotransferase family protein [Spirochaetaceae bacterium]|jgi:dTDP-4-amino-4,6-dideoxygalactose transaminase|nr:DegT/DnrJ/EryC1/StrS aminotransferase family protein [Spirochaetaceae bacterium]
MQDDIPFSRPFIGREEEEAALRVLRSGWLTTGPEALAFEKEFALKLEPQGAQERLCALAVNSATSGLHLALEASGVGPGDVVIVPTYTFAATAEVARYLGAEIAFVDTAPEGFLLDTNQLEQTAARLAGGESAYSGGGPAGRPAAVIPVHFAGLPCDMEAVNKIARRFGMAVIEDAAHALPTALSGGGRAGTAGDAGVFSFYATKTLTTGEGGMVVTRDKELHARMSAMRLHGIDRPVWNRYTGVTASWYYEIADAGFKYNLCDLLAAIGRVQLGRLEQLWQERKKIAAAYDKAFSGDARFIIPPGDGSDARHLYPLRLSGQAPVKRDEFINRLNRRGIGASVHFIPLHTMPYYAARYRIQEDAFPRAMRAFCAEVSLPLWPGMTDAQTGRVIEAVLHVCR